jgi:hypothetical protein
MFDMFGRVVCKKCGAKMNLKEIRRGRNASARFECSNEGCSDESSFRYGERRSVVLR